MNSIKKIARGLKVFSLSFRAYWLNSGPYARNEKFSKASLLPGILFWSVVSITLLTLVAGLYRNPEFQVPLALFEVFGLYVVVGMPVRAYFNVRLGNNDYIQKTVSQVFNIGILQYHLAKLLDDPNDTKSEMKVLTRKFVLASHIYLSFAGEDGPSSLESIILGQSRSLGRRVFEVKVDISDQLLTLILLDNEFTFNIPDKILAYDSFVSSFLQPVWQTYLMDIGDQDQLETKAGVFLMHLQVAWGFLASIEPEDAHKVSWSLLKKELDATRFKLGNKRVTFELDSPVLPSALYMIHYDRYGEPYCNTRTLANSTGYTLPARKRDISSL